MRYEDWTFREAEVRLGEHRELRQALGLTSVPDFTTLYRFLRRLDDTTIDRAVGETVRPQKQDVVFYCRKTCRRASHGRESQSRTHFLLASTSYSQPSLLPTPDPESL